MLDPVPGRTANELARDAGDRLPGLASEFANAATAFNDVTYGELPGTPAAYQMIADLDDHLGPAPSPSDLRRRHPPADWAEVR